MKHILSLFTCFVLFLSPAFCDEIIFIQGDLKEAKARAAREGKLIFLDFWASYCTPCRMMEEYTFTDPSVVDYVRANYIPVKVDIQSFDGLDLKKQYSVSLLPTVIILNSKGIQLGRHEESMGVTKFMATLKKYDNPKNRIKIANDNDNYAYNSNTGYSNSVVNTPPYSYKYPSNGNSYAKNVSEKTKEAPAIAVLNAVSYSNKSKPVNIPVVGAKHAEVSKEAFTIQLGAFSTPDNLQDYINKVKPKTGDARIFVSKKEENGRTMYRVLVGSFMTRQKAQVFLKNHGVSGYVRDFSIFQ